MNEKSTMNPGSCMLYMTGIVGASVYYISEAVGFLGGVVGFLKALVWPAFLVFEALKYFN